MADQYPENLESLDYLYLATVIGNEVSTVLDTSKDIVRGEVTERIRRKRARYLYSEFEKYDNRIRLQNAFPFATPDQIKELHCAFLTGNFEDFCEWGKSYLENMPKGV